MASHAEISKLVEDRQKIFQFVKMSLLNKVFIGRYTERRLVESLCTYKDVIEIDQKDDEFINTLRAVEEKLKSNFDGRFVSSVLGSKSKGYSILTDLSGCAFGSYWFMIKNVAIHDLSMIVSVKCLRAYVIESEPLSSINLTELWNNFNYSKILSSIIHNIAEIITKENIVFTVRFLSALFLSVMVGSYRLLELLLRFFHEFNNAIKVSTPIVLAAIEAVTRAFGGLLILITYMWRGESSKMSMQNRSLQGRSEPKYLQYSPNRKYAEYQNNRNRTGYGYQTASAYYDRQY